MDLDDSPEPEPDDEPEPEPDDEPSSVNAARHGEKGPKSPAKPKSPKEQPPKGPKKRNPAGPTSERNAHGKPNGRIAATGMGTPDPDRPRPAPIDPAFKPLLHTDPALRSKALLLHMIAEPTRAGLIMILRNGPVNVTEITQRIGMNQPSISHHLALLRHGRIATPERRGKHVYYGLEPVGMTLAEVLDMLP